MLAYMILLFCLTAIATIGNCAEGKIGPFVLKLAVLILGSLCLFGNLNPVIFVGTGVVLYAAEMVVTIVEYEGGATDRLAILFDAVLVAWGLILVLF